MEAPFEFLVKGGPVTESATGKTLASGLEELMSSGEYCPCCYRVRGALCETYTAAEVRDRVRAVRVLLFAQGLDALLVPSGDAHSSEYVAACDERRAWLTGFTGSAGLAIVTRSKAALWTDGRYFNQAATQLDGSGIELMRQKEPGVPEPGEWCFSELGNGGKVGVDFATMTVAFAEEFNEKSGGMLELVATEGNLVDLAWGKARPERPLAPVNAHPEAVSGESAASKLARVRAALKEAGLRGLVINALDQIAWLCNLRGADIECNPVFFSYAVVTADVAVLYVRQDVDALFLDRGLWRVEAYDSFGPAQVEAVCGPIPDDGAKLAVERGTATLAIAAAYPQKKPGGDTPPENNTKTHAKTGFAPSAAWQFLDTSPVEAFKAVKNATEIEGLKKAQLRDAAVIASFFAWLESGLTVDKAAPITEWAASEELSRRRALFGDDVYKGDSFPTISSSGANAAVIHYQPSAEESSDIDINSIYLCDTGAQYVDGTTDITRTVHFGTPTAEEKTAYTAVLLGHVELARARFPDGVSGLQLDAIARAPLWGLGIDFNHGTGHGMGAYLNVHEGPIGVGGGAIPADKLSAAAKRRYLAPIYKGHYLSDEPGAYVDGAFGIRLESDLVVIDAPRPALTIKATSRAFLAFEYLTLVPFCRALVDKDLLQPAHIDWIDRFHATCLATLEPFLADPLACPIPDAPAALAWLKSACAPLASC